MKAEFDRSPSGTVIVTLDGDLDVAAADRLAIIGQVAVDRAAGLPVRLDLARVTSIDPAALTVVGEIRAYADAAGSPLELVGLPPELA